MDGYYFYSDETFQKDPYSPEQFAGRQQLLEDLVTWVSESAVNLRIKLISAPPGYGKTWLINALNDRLKNLDNADLFVIFCSARQLIDPAAIGKWLGQVWQQAHAHCPALVAPTPGESIAGFLARLMACWETEPALRPIFLLDGIDELSPSQQRMLETQLLEPVHAYPQARIVVSCRDDFGFKSFPLRKAAKNSVTLLLFTAAESQEQLKKRPEANAGQLPIARQKLLDLVAPYTLTIPYLNTILIRLVRRNLANQANPLLSAGDIRACWLAAIGPKFLEQSVAPEELEENLKTLSKLDCWSQEDFSQQCQLGMNQAATRIGILMKLGVVQHTNDQQYQIVNGLNELIRAAHSA